ncbi:Zinc finger protein [Caenorhabditis elegans]|uniref:Zinc finger protein n=1 Tax=Caenorhabditis elegans TaxID=6239 RepID=Q9U344_CAEEL|nr:Zinc finger protein [Caenorhabditis elegans]CAB54315.1 Zinc finger protein [Caenorhabditis elegans]|eukprot:NP_499833.1 Uncharacterized protein CELE_W06F12.2 [Caenorhabditis elegans]
MGVTACCCCSSKDAAITIGIWSLVSSMGQLGIMGWQMVAIKYERDRAANTLLPNYNTYGRFDIPSYFESYWQSPEERYYTGLFVIQVLCLIAAFFLVFASAAMIYGIHTWSKYLVWPWFPVMLSSILATLAYCIMWWCGDVRSYWLAITIIEIIVVFINIYCVVVVMMYYRRINATTDEYEGKDRRGVRYKINRMGNSRRDLLDSYDDNVHRSPPMKYKPLAQPYPVFPSYSRAGVPQTPIPLPPTQINTPYPIDPMEVQFTVQPKVKNLREMDEDHVGSWVRDQQSIDRGHEARSEPITVSKLVQPTTLKHSRSVPSLHGGTLVSHRDCEHRDDKHRSSSRRRKSRSRHEFDGYSSESDPSDFSRHQRHRSNSKRRQRSRSRYDDSVYDSEADRERERERRRSKRNRQGGSQRSSSKKHRDDRRDRDRERDRNDRDRNREREREERERENRDNERGRRERESEAPRRRKEDDRRSRHQDSQEASGGSQEMSFPLSGGITIPQHIVIPPSSGERGPDGKPVPQKYQINSEITINYDHNGRPVVGPRDPLPTIEEPFRRRQPLPIQSTF